MRAHACGIAGAGVAGRAAGRVSVDIVIPVFNEQRALPGCVRALHSYLDDGFPFEWTITVADNASTDATRDVADGLAGWCPRVRSVHVGRNGKGRAVRRAWLTSEADVVAYMDVDLSTGLDALLPLVAPLATGHSDVAIGSRLAAGARTTRSMRRELLSRGYNGLLRLVHGTRFSDAQCGFKAVRREIVGPLLHRVADDSWFFDTELLLLAEHNDLRVHEVAVDWVEDADSRVRIARAAGTNLRGTARLSLARLSGSAEVVGLPPRPPQRAAHPDAVPARPGVVLPGPAGVRPFAVAAVSLAAAAVGFRTAVSVRGRAPLTAVAALGLTTVLTVAPVRALAYATARAVWSRRGREWRPVLVPGTAVPWSDSTEELSA